jgi:hypothetical protein
LSPSLNKALEAIQDICEGLVLRLESPSPLSSVGRGAGRSGLFAGDAILRALFELIVLEFLPLDGAHLGRVHTVLVRALCDRIALDGDVIALAVCLHALCALAQPQEKEPAGGAGSKSAVVSADKEGSVAPALKARSISTRRAWKSALITKGERASGGAHLRPDGADDKSDGDESDDDEARELCCQSVASCFALLGQLLCAHHARSERGSAQGSSPLAFALEAAANLLDTTRPEAGGDLACRIGIPGVNETLKTLEAQFDQHLERAVAQGRLSAAEADAMTDQIASKPNNAARCEAMRRTMRPFERPSAGRNGLWHERALSTLPRGAIEELVFLIGAPSHAIFDSASQLLFALADTEIVVELLSYKEHFEHVRRYALSAHDKVVGGHASWIRLLSLIVEQLSWSHSERQSALSKGIDLMGVLREASIFLFSTGGVTSADKRSFGGSFTPAPAPAPASNITVGGGFFMPSPPRIVQEALTPAGLRLVRALLRHPSCMSTEEVIKVITSGMTAAQKTGELSAAALFTVNGLRRQERGGAAGGAAGAAAAMGAEALGTVEKTVEKPLLAPEACMLADLFGVLAHLDVDAYDVTPLIQLAHSVVALKDLPTEEPLSETAAFLRCRVEAAALLGTVGRRSASPAERVGQSLKLVINHTVASMAHAADVTAPRFVDALAGMVSASEALRKEALPGGVKKGGYKQGRSLVRQSDVFNRLSAWLKEISGAPPSINQPRLSLIAMD